MFCGSKIHLLDRSEPVAYISITKAGYNDEDIYDRVGYASENNVMADFILTRICITPTGLPRRLTCLAMMMIPAKAAYWRWRALKKRTNGTSSRK